MLTYWTIVLLGVRHSPQTKSTRHLLGERALSLFLQMHFLLAHWLKSRVPSVYWGVRCLLISMRHLCPRTNNKCLLRVRLSFSLICAHLLTLGRKSAVPERVQFVFIYCNLQSLYCTKVFCCCFFIKRMQQLFGVRCSCAWLALSDWQSVTVKTHWRSLSTIYFRCGICICLDARPACVGAEHPLFEEMTASAEPAGGDQGCVRATYLGCSCALGRVSRPGEERERQTFINMHAKSSGYHGYYLLYMHTDLGLPRQRACRRHHLIGPHTHTH